MKQLRLILAGCILAGSVFGQAKREAFEAQDDPPAIVQWARGHKPELGGKGGGGTAGKFSPLMTNHGGPILTSTVTQAIFWGTSWSESVGDKISGLDKFYSGVGGSSYARSNTEYTGTNGQVTDAISYLGHVIDNTAAPSGAPTTSSILGEVCKVVGSSAQANGFYAVYVDQPRGTTGYCAWHSAGKCGGTPIQFAFFFKLDSDGGCDPHSTVAGQSQGLTALANVTGHELSETMTDPSLNAWYDKQGEENADKCAWTFGHAYVTFTNGSQWKIQGNWSNNAYNANTGYTRGCIDGN